MFLILWYNKAVPDSRDRIALRPTGRKKENKRMKNPLIRILCLLLCLVMLISLAACGKESKEEPGTGTDAGTGTGTSSDAANYAYKSEFLSIDSDARWGLTPVIYTDDGFYATGNVVIGRQEIPEGSTEEYEGQYDIYGTMLYFIGMDGKAKPLANYVPGKPIENTENYRDFSSYCNLGRPILNADGKLVALEQKGATWFDGPDDAYGKDEEKYQYYKSENSFDIVVLEKDGTELSRAHVSLDMPDAWLNTYSTAVTPDGSLLAILDQSILAIAPDGSIAWQIQSDDYVNNLVKLADDSVAAVLYGMSGPEMRTIDFSARRLGDSLSIPESAWSFIPGDDLYDFYYTSGQFLYGFRFGEDPVQILNWMSCDINGQSLDNSSLNIRADGTILGVITDYTVDHVESQLFTLHRVPADSLPKKDVITVAQLEYYPDYQFSNRIIRFNRSHDDVRIEYKDYTQYNTEDNSDAGLTKFMTELSAGSVPDILPMSQLPYKQLAARGILEDLSPYIDADSALNRDDFFPNVLTALEADGSLYQVVPGFSVETLVGAASVVGDTPGWTYDEFNAALARMPEGCTPLEPYTTRDIVLNSLLAADMDLFVNWNTGEVNFDSDEFKQLLTFAAQFPADYDWENHDNTENNQELIRQGRQMLARTYLYSLDALLWGDTDFGGKATYIGWPTASGVGSIMRIDSGYAMSRTSTHKDQVWEFLRGMLTEEGQAEVYTIPTNRHVFEKKLEELMTPTYRKDAEGNYILDENGERVQESRGGWIDENGTEHSIYAMTQEQADEVMNVITTCTRVADYSSSIYSIVAEQAEAFFSGQKSVDDVARLIQSKANIYVNEQR